MHQPLLRFGWNPYTREKLHIFRRIFIGNISAAAHTASLQVRTDLSVRLDLQLPSLLTTDRQVSNDAFEIPEPS